MLTAAQLAELNTELTTDPNAYGYAPLIAVGQTNSLANMLNLVRVGIAIKRTTVPSAEIALAIVPADYFNITQASRREWIRMVMGLGEVPTGSQDILDGFIAIFTGDQSLTNLNALRTRDGSRAEQLFGYDVRATRADVLGALALS